MKMVCNICGQEYEEHEMIFYDGQDMCDGCYDSY